MLEAEDVLGGGCRSAELTLPGYVHDLCSTVHALALASPFLRELPLPELECSRRRRWRIRSTTGPR